MQIRQEITIERDPAVVFAYLTDPAKLATWQPSTVAVERERQGSLAVGERFVEVHKALGRELRQTVEVATYDAPRAFELHIVAGAVPLDGRWELDPIATGTRLRFLGHGEIHGAMRLAKPMLARQFRAHHKRLKQILERAPND